MKKRMTFLSMIALAFVGTMMIGCSNKEYDIEQPEQSEQSVGSENVITLTTTINLPDTDTKGLDIDDVNKKLSKTFAEDERMAVLYRSKAGGITRDISDTLRTEDITNGGKTATFTITVYDPEKTEDVTYVYPANMVGGSYPNYHIDYSRLNTQDGTLASIASDLDLATYTGPWVDGNLPAANLTNELAIIAFTLKNADGSVDLTSTITGMTINDGTNNYTVNRYAAAGPIYVAIRPTNAATINYTATDGITNTYTKTVSDKTYKAGQFYQLGLRMTPSSSATGHRLRNSIVGEIVGTDGLAYAVEDKNNLPIGVTAAGMVAYKSGPSGLVIALSDESLKTWSEAESAVAAHKPAVTGHAWRMPSLSDWKQMFAAFGGIETSSTGLKTAITNAGGNTLGDNHYWTSTDKEGYPANAYYIGVSGSDVTYSYTQGKTYYAYARACFAFDFGLFSVSSTTKVKFAPGNLTYTGGTWEFLSHSWEYNYNGSNYGVAEGSQYFHWIDVFNNRNSAGESAVKDAITSALGASWRGLSKDEWSYLLGGDLLFYHVTDSRTVAWHKYAYIKKGGGCYLLIFPDDFVGADWTAAMGTIPTCFDNRGEQSISYTEENFSAMQSAGIVILPPTGRVWRGLYIDIKEYGVRAWYWTKELDMHNEKLQAASLSSWNVSLSYQVKEHQDGWKSYYNPVRLVKNVE